MNPVRNLLETISNFVSPHRYIRSPAFEVSRNLIAWDRMLRNLS